MTSCANLNAPKADPFPHLDHPLEFIDMNILANDGISPSETSAARSGAHPLHRLWQAEQLESFIQTNDIHGILVRSATKVRQPLIDACPSLKFIGRGGVGMDNIDVEYARNQV